MVIRTNFGSTLFQLLQITAPCWRCANVSAAMRVTGWVATLVFLLIATIGWNAWGQLPGQSAFPGQAPANGVSSAPTNGSSSSAAVPSLESTPGQGTGSAGLGTSSQRGRSSAPPRLPSDSGQYFEEYDLKPYTKDLSSIDRPQQAVIDWVLRETGTDVWFTDPFGFISADRSTLRVYRPPHKLLACD
jgi:hypothetical protein